MDMNEAFEKFVEVKELKYGDILRHEARCVKGLFSIDAPTKEQALNEARHYFVQYFDDGEYGDTR